MNWTQDRAANALIKFLAAIPCLEYLILAIAPDSVFGPRVVKRFLQEYHNPNLFYFQFDDFIVPDSKDLLNFFEKHKSTLRAVILRKIHLCDNGWKVLFQKMCEELHLGNIMLDGLFVLQQNAYWSVIFPWCEYGFMSCPGASGFNERQEEEVTDELRRAADEYQSTETRYEDDNFIDRVSRAASTFCIIY
ncbi:uncharacterized protein K452DRAFT_67814 [Aplosporella prunicola CBS 121167]|uniref:Uncharacterized protein n=1 Tax=Aplosporella prunicola CBS 121167 TaxID=1176127 RepID=A0A6A6BTP0_9PEZI|nr:uncharacterized protein K452DRAFT_67814 [Aplosporella prunicola CBS 121167]KAF2146584.1 hypothetical protein K452DRAFT_67814 [Aplosporella prunicola CBS 121167]